MPDSEEETKQDANSSNSEPTVDPQQAEDDYAKWDPNVIPTEITEELLDYKRRLII